LPPKKPSPGFARHLQGAAEALNFFQEAVDLPKFPMGFSMDSGDFTLW